MTSTKTNTDLVNITVALHCTHQLKQNIIRVARDFVEVRDAYLNQLPAFAIDAERRTTFVENFRRVNNEYIQEQEIPLGLVVFGTNSSGKTSFIQHFLEIGDILPSGVGPVTARIIKLTYASAENARALIYSSLAARLSCKEVPIEIDLRSFFSTSEPQWEEIRSVLSKHLNRAENSEVDLTTWAKSFVEICVPSPTLQMNIDIYDTPGFVSGNREHFLIENLYELVKNVRPTLLFLYENSSVAETDVNCFLGMKEAIGSLDRTPVFFLNTKADVATIVKDSRMNPRSITLDHFRRLLGETRRRRYELLREQAGMANELLGGLPALIDECQCFDICSIPKGRTQWRALTDHMNKETFSRIVSFAVQASSEYATELANDILSTIDDFFDLALSASYRDSEHFRKLHDDAIEWSSLFFAQFKTDLPKLVQHLHDSIVRLFEAQKMNIANRAARLIRDDDPLAMLLPVNSKTVRDFIRIAVEEEIMKVAVNETMKVMRSQVKTVLELHFDDRMKRRNELLRIAQRQILPEISPSILIKQRLLSKFIEGLIKLPMRTGRFFRSLTSRRRTDEYNKVAHNQITSEEDPTYKILDCLDLYASLSNESKRLAFAEQYLNVLLKSILKRKQDFEKNLNDWMEQQQKAFNASIKSNYTYVTAHLDTQHILHNLNTQYYGKFAKIECQILAAKQLYKFNNVGPTIKEDDKLGQGAFFSIYAAEWGDEKNLVVKKLFRPISTHPYMAYLDAHYQRVVSLLQIRKTVPLKYLYENKLDNGEHELLIILPRYSVSLRDYLCTNIQNITLDKALNFAIDIAQILAELHRNEVVHRDIKASNILLDENNECHLTDFGTAKEGTFNDTIVGTMPLPPEMLSALTHEHGTTFTYNGAAADIYSFGLLLYEMHPKSSYQRIHARKFEDIQRLLQDRSVRSVTGFAAFVKLIEACVQTQPTARPSAQSLVERLRMIKKNHVDHEFVDAKECVVCFEYERQVRFRPCGHKVVCESCWNELRMRNEGRNCIYCRAAIEEYQRDIENDQTLFMLDWSL